MKKEQAKKNIPLVDLKAGYYPFKKEIINAISGVLDSMQLNLGPNVGELEKEFASYVGTKWAVGVGSGTDAIMIALLACGLEKGDEVITSCHSFFATLEAVHHAGCVPVFSDIDKDTFNIDPALIEQKITKKTKAIIPVHMYGQPCKMDKIMAMAKANNIFIVEDACQAHGALHNSQKCGQIGNAGCFSFYFTKNLGAYGEGGIITTDDDEVAENARKLRNHGHASKYEHVFMGYNSRLDEIQATILRVKLKSLEKFNEARQHIAGLYNENLKELPVVLPTITPGFTSVYHLYVIQSQERDELIDYLSSCGIGTGIHYKNPMHTQKVSKQYGYKEGDFPIAEGICRKILSLPIYPELKDSDVLYITDCIKKFYNTK